MNFFERVVEKVCGRVCSMVFSERERESECVDFSGLKYFVAVLQSWRSTKAMAHNIKWSRDSYFISIRLR